MNPPNSGRATKRESLRKSFMQALNNFNVMKPAGMKPDLEKPLPQAPTPQSSLQDVVQEAWKTRHHSRYKAAKVLLAYWSDVDDPSFCADQAAQKLWDVFERKYGFDVQVWLIPRMDQPQAALAAKLSHFVREYGNDTENLLIFWYGGFARESEGGSGPVMWFGDPWGQQVNSAIVPQILGPAKSDVLTLYDCGYSLHGQTVPGPRVFEHLGANASSSNVPSFGSVGSFTRSIVHILDQPNVMAHGISIVDIHRKIVNRARNYQAHKRNGEDGHNTMSGRENTYTSSSWPSGTYRIDPVYCRLSAYPPRSKGDAPSIVLSRLDYPLEAFGYENGRESGREAVINLHLRNREIDLKRWKEWILSAPYDVDHIVVKINE